MRKIMLFQVTSWTTMLILAVICWAGLQDGLVGYWSMNEGNGDKVGDLSGNGYDGTAQNVTWVEGKYDMALEFNGVDSQVDIPYSQEMTPTEGATIAAWVFPTDTTRSCIFGQFEGYGMALFTDLKLKSVIWGDDWVSDVAIPVEQWSHVAMTWDVKTGNRRMFVDGKLVDEKGGAQPIPNVQNHFGIGLWVGWPAAWGDDMFKGIIDELRFWNRVLSEDEIAQATQPAAVAPVDMLPLMWSEIKVR